MGIAEPEAVNVGAFSEGQRRNLDYHRDRIFLIRKKETTILLILPAKRL